MTPRLPILAALVFTALPGCSAASSAAPAEASAPWLEAGPLQPILRDDGTTDPRVRGAWVSRGYGFVLAIDEDGVKRFHSGDTCYAPRREGEALSAMDSVTYRFFREIEPGASAIFQLLDGDTNVVFDRLDGLPADCTNDPASDPEAVAAAFLDHFERHYAFFGRRPPGHEERAARVRAVVGAETDEAGLWDALAAYMEGLSDSHTKLIGTVAGEKRRVQDGQGTTLPRIRASEGGEGEWLLGLIGQAKESLGESAHHEAQDRILWGMIDEPETGARIGYLQVFVMGGFTKREDFASPEWAEAEMAEFDRIMDEATAAFEGADAVIVDLSNNRGGWDRVAKAIPSRFAAAPFTGFTTVSQGSGLAPFPHRITPPALTYTGPVFLMTSDVTVSGGELATLAFRQLPNVTQVGSTTRGAFSTPLAKPLPNGWLLELSNETFAAPDGTVFEETGIAPQVELDIYPEAAPVAGHWEAVMEVARMAAQASQ